MYVQDTSCPFPLEATWAPDKYRDELSVAANLLNMWTGWGLQDSDAAVVLAMRARLGIADLGHPLLLRAVCEQLSRWQPKDVLVMLENFFSLLLKMTPLLGSLSFIAANRAKSDGIAITRTTVL